MTNFLKLEQVSKAYGSGPKQLEVLRQFDMELAEAEFLAVVGSSGSGKTTLLNLIAGLDRVDEGRIFLAGRELTKQSDNEWIRVRQHAIGFVFQFNQLLPEFTALENVMLPGLLSTDDEELPRAKAHELLSRMGLAERGHHFPSQLSGGEQQRVAIARALINNPQLVLADEPTGNLDYESGQRVIQLFLDLQRDLKISVIMVTHNQALAELCDRIQTINRVGI